MAFIHGKNATVTVNAAALTSFCDNLNLSRDTDTAETTVFGVNDKTFLPGLIGGNMTLSGSYDPTASTGPAAVLEALLGAAPFAVVLRPGGGATGQRSHGFNALLTNYTETSGISDVVKFSASLLVTGAVTTTTL